MHDGERLVTMQMRQAGSNTDDGSSEVVLLNEKFIYILRDERESIYSHRQLSSKSTKESYMINKTALK